VTLKTCHSILPFFLFLFLVFQYLSIFSLGLFVLLPLLFSAISLCSILFFLSLSFSILCVFLCLSFSFVLTIICDQFSDYHLSLFVFNYFSLPFLVTVSFYFVSLSVYHSYLFLFCLCVFHAWRNHKPTSLCKFFLPF
jgi:hypothetical protein